MKNSFRIALVAGLLAMPVSAFAESLSGTVMSIDSPGQKVTLRRAGTNETVILNVNNAEMLAGFREGAAVTLDASNRGLNNWEANAAQSAMMANRSGTTTVTTTT